MLDSVKKNRFALDVLTLVGGTTISQIVTILIAPVLTRLYGPEDFGVWALFLSITGIIGIIACFRYEHAIMLPESDKDAINLLALSIIIVLLITIITIPLAFIFKSLIVSILNSPLLGKYLWFMPPFIFFNGFFLALYFWNSRTRNFKSLSFARVSNSLFSAGTQIGVGVSGYSTGIGLIVGNLVGCFVSTIVLLGQIWKNDKKIFIEHINSKRIIYVLRKYKKFPLIDTWSALLNAISWQLPTFFLAFFFSPSIVGFYSLGFRLLQMPMSLIGGSITQVFFQRTSVAKSENKLDLLVENVFKLLVIIGMFPLLTLSIVGSDVFTVVFGYEWTEAGVYTQILSIWAFIWFLSSPLSTIYIVMEKQQFGFRFNVFNFITRLLSLTIGGVLGSPRIALILFAASGVIVYGYLCFKMLRYSGVNMSRVASILISNVTIFIPAGVILIVLKMLGINQFVLVVLSGIFIFLYYVYVIKTDKQLNEIMDGFEIKKKLKLRHKS
jgi:O-antigen/teichoic acid export membrane protein